MPGLSVADAVSTRLVEDLLMPLLPNAILEPLQSRFEHARLKLAAMEVDHKVAAWSGKVRYVQPSLHMVAPVVRPEVLEVVQKALMGDLELLVTYCRSTGDTIEGLMLHPQAMIQRGQVTYVVAMAFGYDDVRLYALHRMEKAETSFNPCRRLPGFDLDAYLQTGALQFASGASLKLQAWVHPDLAGILIEKPMALDQLLQADSSAQGFQLDATVQNTWQLCVVDFGSRCAYTGQGAKLDSESNRRHFLDIVNLYKYQFSVPKTETIWPLN